MSYTEIKNKFEEERSKEDGHQIMRKAISIINDVGSRFLEMDGDELYQSKTKLVGYKFYLSDYLFDLKRISESKKIELKNIRAKKWDEISEEIKAKEGKVKNKEQIENILEIETEDLQHEQILYDALYYNYKLKVSAIDDVLMAISQRTKELQNNIQNI